MKETEIILLVLICVLVIAVTALFLYVLLNNRRDHIKEIRLGLNKDLFSFSERINREIDELNEQTYEKLTQLEDRMNRSIFESAKNTNETFEKINERMVRIDETQRSLDGLSENIISLQSVLQDKKSRGTFGEIELYSLLESAFGNDPRRYARQYTLSNNTKADAVIFGPDSLGMICIDSKFPLENYRRIYDNGISQQEREKAKTAFRNDVLKHINDISSKYIIPGETAEMAYMFIPAEAVFAEIYASFPEITDRSYEARVYIVSALPKLSGRHSE